MRNFLGSDEIGKRVADNDVSPKEPGGGRSASSAFPLACGGEKELVDDDPGWWRRKRSQRALEEQVPRLAKLAEQLHGFRARRSRRLDAALLGEPGWDILLDLFVRGSKYQRTSITSACIASGKSEATALRWLKLLEERELIQTTRCQADRRVRFVELTADGRARTIALLAELHDMLNAVFGNEYENISDMVGE